MIPLSVAHWYRHVNVCEAVGGRFRAESRYMIHAMIDTGDDPARAFPQGQEIAAMEMGP